MDIEWQTPGDDPHFLSYKQAKRDFAKAKKQREYEYEIEQMREIYKSDEIDQNHFWYLINKRKGKSNSSLHPLKLSDDTIIYSPDDIRKEWAQYFETLYTPSDNNSYDRNFRTFVENQFTNMHEESLSWVDDILESKIHEDEVLSVIKELKTKKAPGCDQITSEHIKYGGNRLMQCLTKLFNYINKYEYIPTSFKIGIIIPIPKGTKSRLYQDNHRGITLLPTVAKMYEKILYHRMLAWARKNNLLHKLQGAERDKCSSLNTAWVIREAISTIQDKGKTVYIGSLDIRKCYDSVWQKGAFYKLFHDFHLRGKSWRLLQKLYDGFRCKVRIAGRLSDSFQALQGLHQGAPCSMLIFVLYINELLHELDQGMGKVKIGNNIINSPCFADDVCTLALSKNALQQRFTVAYKYSCKWQFSFNPEKCAYVIVGKDDMPSFKIKLGSNVIKKVCVEEHLGTALCCDAKSELEYMKKRIKTCKTMNCSIQGIRSHRVPHFQSYYMVLRLWTYTHTLAVRWRSFI